MIRSRRTSPERLLARAAILLLIAGCGDDRLPEYEFTGVAMGTTWSVKLVAPPPALDTSALQQMITASLSKTEKAMSTYLLDSELTQFNLSRSTAWIRTSSEFCSAVAGAQSIAELTDGAFDVTVGPLVNLWGFGPPGSVSKPPDDADIAKMRRRVGHHWLHTDCSVPALRKDLADLYVDLSAYAKGYAVDRVADLLDGLELANYLIEVGGELRMRGRNADGGKWAIAVEKPIRGGRSVQSIVGLTDSALATSGDYRNYFEYRGRRYSHTIDPRTGTPVTHDAASVTVIADTAAYADAMATALLVLGPGRGLDFAERENIAAYFLLRTDGDIEERMTKRFATEVAQ